VRALVDTAMNIKEGMRNNELVKKQSGVWSWFASRSVRYCCTIRATLHGARTEFIDVSETSALANSVISKSIQDLAGALALYVGKEISD
jgi:hypothetical protein